MKIKVIGLIIFCAFVNIANGQDKKSLIDFFKPIKIQEELVEYGKAWGSKVVMPRDTANGLEDATRKKWSYWDGAILKDKKGKFHMYASRWSQDRGHGWRTSKVVHAESNTMLGPYIDKGLITEDYLEGIGHNVTAIKTHEGKYAIVISGNTHGEVFVSDSPNGKFKLKGKIKIDPNGHNIKLAQFQRSKDRITGMTKKLTPDGKYMANVTILKRPEGGYMILTKTMTVLVSENDICGPYKIVAPKVFSQDPKFKKARIITQKKNTLEDGVIWHSAGMYHLVFNDWGVRTAYHFTSKDGIKNWKYRGVAYGAEKGFMKYNNGVNCYWNKLERPNVYIEKGVVKAFLFSVMDVDIKKEDKRGDNHASKVFIVPFDGKAFNKYVKKLND